MINRLLATVMMASLCYLAIGQSASFTHDFDPAASNSCAPISISFTNTSTGATSYVWSIDGIDFSTSDSPQRSFATGGSFNVCLNASNGASSDQACQTLSISEPADIQITNNPTANCAPFATSIDVISNEVIAEATIDYGDGVIDVITPGTSSFSYAHTYTQEGTYSVTVSVLDNNGCSATISKANVFIVRNVNTVGFDIGLSSCQIPLDATFTNTTPNPGNYMFDWDFGDGATVSNQQNAMNPYNTPGSYDVSLTATDILTGCSDTYTVIDAINSQSVASIVTSENINGNCSLKEIAFSIENLPPFSTVSWDFGDGYASGSETPIHIYNTAGCFTPSVTITTGNGCVFTINNSACIESLGPVDPSFTLTGDLNTCNATSGTSINHVPNSSIGVGWDWDFADGNSSTQQNPTHTYTGFGTYQPTLTTTFSDGCQESYTDANQTVRIENPTIDIVVDTTRGCIPFDVNFSIAGSNDPIASIDWTFGPGASPVSITGNTPMVTYTAVGDYDVVAIVTTTTGCTYTVSAADLIEVGDIPNVDFTSDLMSACVDSPIQFTDLSDATVDEWEWDFGAGTSMQQNPIHEYTTPDSFEVTLKVWANGCPAEVTADDKIQIAEPKADFAWSFDCYDLNRINFTDLSTGADSIWWDFGDGSASTDLANPTHLYASEGNYTVTQYTKNFTTGCTDDHIIPINLVNPVADFRMRDTTFCWNDQLTIENLSSNIYNVQWSIGSVNPSDYNVMNAGSNGDDARIQFTQTDDFYDFTVTYSIDPACPANRTVTYTDTVRVDYIFVNFNYTLDGCLPTDINVTPAIISIPSNDPTLNYTWNFGDSVRYGTNPTFQFDELGFYDVTLNVTNEAGCNISETHSIPVIVDTTTVKFDWSMVDCATREIQFINTSDGGSANAYEWDFGDGSGSSAPVTAHQYAANGDYDVRLVVHTSNGCSDTLIQTIQVYDPVADFAGDNLTQSCPVPALITGFTNNSLGAVSYEWDFGDGGTSTLMNPSHAFSSIEDFDIKLIATSINGCTDTLTRSDYIQVGGPFAELGYSVTESCTGSDIDFIVTGSGVINYTWDFGDGNAISSIPAGVSDTVSHAYVVPGQYQPILIAEDVSGCRVPYIGTDSISVFEINADFSVDDDAMCSNDLNDVNFTSSITTSATIDSIEWLLPGSTQANATGTMASNISYTATGAYDVTMIVYTSVCTETVTKTAFINVYDPPSFTAPNDTSVCDNGATVQLSILDGLGLTYSWDNPGSLTCDDCPNPQANPTTNTTYTITGTSPGGCSTTRTMEVTVDDSNVQFISMPTVENCIGDTRTVDLPASASNLNWTADPNLILLCTDCNNQQVTVNGSGVVTVTYDYLSCQLTETLTIDAWDPTSVDESVYNQSICPGDVVDLTRPYPGTITIRANDINATPIAGTTYAPAADTKFYTEVSHYGCTVIDSFDVTIDMPTVNVTPDFTICIGDNPSIMANGGANYSYTWSSDEAVSTLSCTNCASPSVQPSSTAIFSVIADNGNGCIANGSVTVTVNNITADELPPSYAVCVGSTTKLTLPGDVTNVQWFNTAGLTLSQTTGLTTDVTASANGSVDVSYVRDFCTITENIAFDLWDPTSVDAGTDDVVCQGEPLTLPIAFPATATVVWRAGSLTAMPLASNTINPLTADTYYLEVTNHGCTAIDSVFIDLDLPTMSASADVDICLGDSSQLTVTGDPSINSYNWDNSIAGLSCYSCPDPFAKPLITTEFIVIATNVNGCTARDTVLVTVNDSIPNLLPDTSNVCINDLVQYSLSAYPELSNISWSSPLGINVTNANQDAEITATDTNYVDVTYDWLNCTYTERISILPWDDSAVDAGVDQLVCQGAQVILPVNYPGTVIWREGSATAAPLTSNTVYPTVTTTYYLEVQYNGCSGTDEITINIDLPVITTSGDISICIGTSTTLWAAGDAGNTYDWAPTFALQTPDSDTTIASPTSTVAYTVTATNTNSCTVSETVTVTVTNPQSDILPDTIKVCLDDIEQINVIPESGTSNIQWSTNIPGGNLSCIAGCTNPTVVATDTGTVTLTYEYEFCQFTETVFIDTWNPATVDAGPIQLICLGDTVTLPQNYPGTFEWREGSSTAIPLFEHDVEPTQDTWYYVTVNNHGCTGIDSVLIQIDQPSIILDVPAPICVGSSVRLYVVGAQSDYTFQWDDNQQGLSCLDCNSPVAQPQYTSSYTVTGTNSNGCTITDNVTVQVDQDTINLIADTIYACINQTTTLDMRLAENPGVDASSIFWATALPLSCQTCPNPTLSIDNSGPIVLNYGYNSCMMREEIYVVAWDPATVDAGPDQTICAGEEIALNRNYPGTVSWYFDSMTSSALNGSGNVPTQSGKYYIQVDNYGCSGLDSMNVTVLPNADIDGYPVQICEGDSVILDVIGDADSVLFNNANSLSDPRSWNPTAKPLSDITYHVIGYNNGCGLDTAVFEVTVHPNPTVDMRLPAEFVEGDEIRLQAEVNATDNLSYLWGPGNMIDCSTCQLPLFVPTASTLVSLTVTNDETGCVATDTATITQKYVCKPDAIGMPSAFSPNNDGLNDHIKPVSLNEISDFKIFNRWGELVFQSDASGIGWDGTYKGQPLKRGVYVYVAEGVCRFDGSPLMSTGDFTLIR